MAEAECVIYHLRDTNPQLVTAWEEQFLEYEDVQVSQGDIFREAPAVDAVVSPANSFGFMEGGGIDSTFKKFFGPQLQQRLQYEIQDEYGGEVLVGQAVIIPTYGEDGRDETKDWTPYNDGIPIKYFICAPTMRVPDTISNTANAYLAFRGVILAVRSYNSRPGVEQIRSVMVPGLGTSSGKMPYTRCAWQMLQAYETFYLGKNLLRLKPAALNSMMEDDRKMREYDGQ